MITGVSGNWPIISGIIFLRIRGRGKEMGGQEEEVNLNNLPFYVVFSKLYLI